MGPKVKIGFSIDHTKGREPFLAKLREATEDSHALLILKDAQDDPETQGLQANELIKEGIEVLVVIPCDPAKAGPMVAAAHIGGIKVISLQRLIPDTDLDYFIDFNKEKAGELQAQAMAEKVSKGRYVFFEQEKGDPACSANIQKGRLKALQSFISRGDILISDSKFFDPTAGTESSMENILSKDSNKVDAVLTSDPSLAEGAGEALEKAKLSPKISLAGMGDDLPTCRRIASGTQALTIYEPPHKLAEETAYLAAKLARKATEFDCQFVEIPNGHRLVHAVLLTPMVVNSGNLDSTIIQDKVQKKEDVYGKR